MSLGGKTGGGDTGGGGLEPPGGDRPPGPGPLPISVSDANGGDRMFGPGGFGDNSPNKFGFRRLARRFGSDPRFLESLGQALNYFSTLNDNPDLNAAMGVYRDQITMPSDGGLFSDSIFSRVRERGMAQALEQSRRTAGLFSTGSQTAAGEFLSSVEGQQRAYEDQRRTQAAAALFNLGLQRGQAAFLPLQMLATLRSPRAQQAQPVYNNSTAQLLNLGGQLGGAYLGGVAQRGYFGQQPGPG